MHLIERDTQLAQLTAWLDAVRAGDGRIAVVSGEAGIGKTVLLKQFRKMVQPQAVVLWGMCDDLYTPQALAPFYDIAFQLGGSLAMALPDASTLRLIGHTLLETLREQARPTIMVIEDIHWADEATLDLIRFLSRRIESLPVLLILTVRDGEVLQAQKLWTLLGSLPAAQTERLHLAPLSTRAVQHLAAVGGRGDADTIYQLTHGNPFYVTELLATTDTALPHSVRDAVLARAARLSEQAQRVLQAVSIVPNHAEEWLIRAVIDLTSTTLTELLNSGMLALQNGFLTFRHELARRALAEALPIATTRELHRAIFQALRAHAGEAATLARLVHHAAHGDLGEAVIKLAPQAAQQASAVNAHREAAAHYATALRYTHLLMPEQHATFLEARGEASYLSGNWETALAIYQQALTIRRQLGHTEQIGIDLSRMSRLAWGSGKNRESRQYAVEAVRTLRRLPPGQSLASAYSMLSQWHMKHFNAAPTRYWGEKAIALARQVQVVTPLIDAKANIGTVNSSGLQRAAGLQQLHESLQLAREHKTPDQAARIAINLVIGYIEQQQLQAALAYAEQGIHFADEHDFAVYSFYLYTLKSLVLFHQGDWATAEQISRWITSQLIWPRDYLGLIPLTCYAIRALIAARRGSADTQVLAASLLDRTETHIEVPEDAGFIYLPRAEVAWLQGDLAACRAEAQGMLTLLGGRVYTAYQSQALFWLWRCGESVDAAELLIEPHRLQIAGDWHAAAHWWAQAGYPYEQAMALADGDEAALHEAFAILDRLGAHAAMDYVRKRLRDLGAESIPRGANRATRANVAGLTRRQMEVLALLTLSNADIAARLHISPKTVEHHVSAILGKLEVETRDDAIRVAQSLADQI
jgi:ATP/maltotriose-dependent transcriptional regulator MalT